MSASSPGTAQSEVLEICRDLIRIDTSNFGDDSGPGERAAAIEFALEGLYLARRISKDSDGTETVYG